MKKLTKTDHKAFNVPPPARLTAIALTLAGMPALAFAADAVPAHNLDPVVVTATRTAQPLSQAAASISVIEAQDLEQTATQTFTDALLDIPNVDVESSDSVMFSRISIRGSDANQITYLIDGMRQDDTTVGGNQFIGIFIDPEIIKQVEVKRGGGSSLYGNGGIGGTLAVTTKDAADFLAGSDRNYGSRVKTGYATDTQDWQKSVYAFGRYGMWDGVVGVNRRDGGDIKTSKGKRGASAADSDYTSYFAKISAMPSDDLKLSLSYNRDDANDAYDSTDSWGLSSRQKYENTQDRITAKADYFHGPLVNLSGAVQYVKSEYAFDTGVRQVRNKFDSIGGNLQNTFEFTGWGQHALTVGADFYRKQQSGTNLDAGTWVSSSDRPDSTAYDSGLFLQDAYAINEYVTVTPVLRWNYYKRESNTGFPSVSDGKVTPGLTLSLTPTSAWNVWGSVNTGYRPPVLDELYFTMQYPGFIETAIVIANPDLKPERSTNWEAGTSLNLQNVLARDDRLFGKFVLFYDDVKDFIGQTSWSDSQDPSIWYFSAKNNGHVVRKGIELSAAYEIGNFSTTMSYGLVHAVDKETDELMRGITPQSVNWKLAYVLPQQDLSLWYRLHWRKGGESSQETAWGSGEYFRYGSFATHSLGVEWSPKIDGWVNFQAGVAAMNLFNKEYRMLNGSYGYGSGVRLWVSAQF